MEQALRPVPWRACLLVFAVALLFRLGWVVATDQIHQFPRKEMVRIAMTFAQRGELADPFAAPTGPTALASPVYPVFLGLIFRTFGTGVAAEVVKCLLTCLVSALRCAMIPWLAICLGLSLRAGMIGGFLSAFYLGALATDIKGDWAEAYAATALVALFLAAIRIGGNGRLGMRSAAVLGFWWGLALLLSPALASILGCFILVGAIRFMRESPRQYIQFAAVLGLVAGLVILPWPVRNDIRLGSPIWAKDNFGIMLLNSNHPGAGWDVFGNENFIEQTTPSWQPAVALKLKAVGRSGLRQIAVQGGYGVDPLQSGNLCGAGGAARVPFLVSARVECAPHRSGGRPYAGGHRRPIPAVFPASRRGAPHSGHLAALPAGVLHHAVVVALPVSH